MGGGLLGCHYDAGHEHHLRVGFPGSGMSSVAMWLAGMIKPCVHVAACSLATVVHIPPQEGEPLNALEGTTAAGAGGDIDGATFDQLRYKNSCLVADSFGEAGVNVVLELDITGDAPPPRGAASVAL